MNIAINDQIHMSAFQESDRPNLLAHLNDREIYDRTLRIPFPYTEADADRWFALVADMTRQQGRPLHWAIRTADGGLIGACGLEGYQKGKSHRVEIGYWLVRPYWGRGIMTDVVSQVCRIAFEELGLVKIMAHVFAPNRASARVLEKCGFQEEGFLRKHFEKEGKFLDARLFGRVR